MYVNLRRAHRTFQFGTARGTIPRRVRHLIIFFFFSSRSPPPETAETARTELVRRLEYIASADRHSVAYAPPCPNVYGAAVGTWPKLIAANKKSGVATFPRTPVATFREARREVREKYRHFFFLFSPTVFCRQYAPWRPSRAFSAGTWRFPFYYIIYFFIL